MIKEGKCVGVQVSFSARDNFPSLGWPTRMAPFPPPKYSSSSLYIIRPFPHLDNQEIRQPSHHSHHTFQQSGRPLPHKICGYNSCTDRPCWAIMIMTSPQACIPTEQGNWQSRGSRGLSRAGLEEIDNIGSWELRAGKGRTDFETREENMKYKGETETSIFFIRSLVSHLHLHLHLHLHSLYLGALFAPTHSITLSH